MKHSRIPLPPNNCDKEITYNYLQHTQPITDLDDPPKAQKPIRDILLQKNQG